MKNTNQINTYFQKAGPPPGAGRTFLQTGFFLVKTGFLGVLDLPGDLLFRRKHAEPSANTTRPDGNRTGMAFPDRSGKGPALGLALILLSTLLLIIAARTIRYYAPLDFQCRPGDVNTISGTRTCGVRQ